MDLATPLIIYSIKFKAEINNLNIKMACVHFKIIWESRNILNSYATILSYSSKWAQRSGKYIHLHIYSSFINGDFGEPKLSHWLNSK